MVFFVARLLKSNNVQVNVLIHVIIRLVWFNTRLSKQFYTLPAITGVIPVHLPMYSTHNIHVSILLQPRRTRNSKRMKLDPPPQC